VRGEAIKARAHGGRIASPDGKADGCQLVLPAELSDTPLEELAAEQIEAILMRGSDAGLTLYRFKKNLAELPRVKYALDFLRTLEFDTLLDVGSGRGAFLWPCVSAFPHVRVRSVELSPSWGTMFDAVRLGGMSNFSWTQADFCKLDEADCSYDVVTLFEVLGHILPVACAIRNAVRLAKKYIVVSAQTRPTQPELSTC
jgi:2-polyprenyl-3-methyl-5-hydroxy-6-metoxy-1,4-benzoquinol methylase